MESSPIHDFKEVIFANNQREVFYFPSFGPVYTHGEPIDRFLDDILGYFEDKTILPYDKDKRWFDQKPEYIDVPSIKRKGDDLYVPVINSFQKPTLKLFLYAKNQPGTAQFDYAQTIAETIRKEQLITKASLVSLTPFQQAKNTHTSNLYMKRFKKEDYLENLPENIYLYHTLPPETQKTFELLTKEPELYGSQMLWYQYLKEGKKISPIFVTVIEQKVVGMIGPLDTLIDPWGKLQLLAPYFEVSRGFRGHGLGKKLWKTAMSWAYQNKATYLLIQAEQGEPADYFYQKRGLSHHGSLTTTVL